MEPDTSAETWQHLCRLFKPHPWHGVSIGLEAPHKVTCYIEIVPTDTVKYEIDKNSGYLRVDRPQRYSNVCPTLYGFLPQTFCGETFSALCALRLGRNHMRSDEDPLDICVFTERELSHGDILLRAIPIGGLRMVDGNEADDKILAVLDGDAVYGGWNDIADCPGALIERIKHYFLTYKQAAGGYSQDRFIADVYGREEAHEVIRRSRQDYQVRFEHLQKWLAAFHQL
jgi:inorganic pyrophosphatase